MFIANDVSNDMFAIRAALVKDHRTDGIAGFLGLQNWQSRLITARTKSMYEVGYHRETGEITWDEHSYFSP
jgi:hypothetical protein